MAALRERIKKTLLQDEFPTCSNDRFEDIITRLEGLVLEESAAIEIETLYEIAKWLRTEGQKELLKDTASCGSH